MVSRDFSSYQRAKANDQIDYLIKLKEDGPIAFYFGLPFVAASVVCFVVAVLTKTNYRDKKKRDASRRKRTFLYVLGSLFALIGFFFWLAFFEFIRIVILRNGSVY